MAATVRRCRHFVIDARRVTASRRPSWQAHPRDGIAVLCLVDSVEEEVDG
jgi:hypothetical protein